MSLSLEGSDHCVISCLENASASSSENKWGKIYILLLRSILDVNLAIYVCCQLPILSYWNDAPTCAILCEGHTSCVCPLTWYIYSRTIQGHLSEEAMGFVVSNCTFWIGPVLFYAHYGYLMLFHVLKCFRSYISTYLSEAWVCISDVQSVRKMLKSWFCCIYITDNCYSSVGNSNKDCSSLSSCIAACLHQETIDKFWSGNCCIKWGSWQLQRYFGVSIDAYIVWPWCKRSSKDHCHITAVLLNLLKCNLLIFHACIAISSIIWAFLEISVSYSWKKLAMKTRPQVVFFWSIGLSGLMISCLVFSYYSYTLNRVTIRKFFGFWSSNWI